MALKPKYNPEVEVARAEHRAFQKMFDSFEMKVRRNLVKKWKNTDEVNDWFQVSFLPTLVNRLETLAAKQYKDMQDYINIASLVALIINFRDGADVDEQQHPHV